MWEMSVKEASVSNASSSYIGGEVTKIIAVLDELHCLQHTYFIIFFSFIPKNREQYNYARWGYTPIEQYSMIREIPNYI